MTNTRYVIHTPNKELLKVDVDHWQVEHIPSLVYVGTYYGITTNSSSEKPLVERISKSYKVFITSSKEEAMLFILNYGGYVHHTFGDK